MSQRNLPPYQNINRFDYITLHKLINVINVIWKRESVWVNYKIVFH
jgi:hypothetical protein